MRLTLLLAASLATSVTASNWFGTKAIYNKWHETELERWLSDNNVPYPTPADRKDLENLVKDNWQANVVTPYQSWETPQLVKWLSAKGYEAKKGTEKNKNALVDQVKGYWTETEDTGITAYESVKGWIFDTWSDSQLKAFLDRNGIPNPQPRTRDSLLSTARENYQKVADKAGEAAAYPGDWLYHSWSESDLKAWADERGIPVPQPSTRDKLIASVRRNSRIASNNLAAYSSAAAASAASATQSLSDALLDSWSDSQIKEWADKNGIKVPQGSKRNELLALARKHRAQLTGDNVSASAASAYGAATSKAGNQYAQATQEASYQASNIQSQVFYWINWAKAQVGLGAASASSAAYAGASSASSAGYAGASAASSAGYAGASSASSAGYSAADAASSGASSAATAVSASGKSAASVASASAKSAASVASVSLSSFSSSLASAASSASSSASKAASKSGAKAAKQAGDAAAESLSSAKHRVQEAAQRATDYAREEL